MSDVNFVKQEIAPIGPLDWKNKFKVSQAEIDKISDADWVIKGLFAKGAYHVVCAEGNGGKTTIVMYLSTEMVDKGYNVTYVNADINAVHSKDAWYEAARGGFDLLLPDMKEGLSMKDIVEGLEYTAAGNYDLSQEVWIFDTLKKMTDLINKSASKRLYETFRRLTARGMTIICLAHTNKYTDNDNKPIYEGTGDLRNDCDNLIYLIPKNNEDGSLTVSAEPDKERAALERMSFNISSERVVTRCAQYVDVTAARLEQQRREDDQDVIEVITGLLNQEAAIQSKIVAHCRTHSIGKRSANTVLKRYTNDLWNCTRQFKDNAKKYELTTPLGKRANGQTEPDIGGF